MTLCVAFRGLGLACLLWQRLCRRVLLFQAQHHQRLGVTDLRTLMRCAADAKGNITDLWPGSDDQRALRLCALSLCGILIVCPGTAAEFRVL